MIIRPRHINLASIHSGDDLARELRKVAENATNNADLALFANSPDGEIARLLTKRAEKMTRQLTGDFGLTRHFEKYSFGAFATPEAQLATEQLAEASMDLAVRPHALRGVEHLSRNFTTIAERLERAAHWFDDAGGAVPDDIGGLRV